MCSCLALGAGHLKDVLHHDFVFTKVEALLKYAAAVQFFDSKKPDELHDR